MGGPQQQDDTQPDTNADKPCHGLSPPSPPPAALCCVALCAGVGKKGLTCCMQTRSRGVNGADDLHRPTPPKPLSWSALLQLLRRQAHHALIGLYARIEIRRLCSSIIMLPTIQQSICHRSRPSGSFWEGCILRGGVARIREGVGTCIFFVGF